MQKLIAKYGLAAHLAILVTAPLLLFPFVSGETLATVLLWLSLPAALFLFLEPSVRGNEQLHDARRRLADEIVHDPLFWILLTLVAFAGLRALNGGIALVYDAEKSVWSVSDPAFPLFPGCVGASGYLPFACSVALLVTVEGCRHALGRSARSAFLLVASGLSGLAAVLAYGVILQFGNPAATAALKCGEEVWTFAGFVFGLHLMGGTVALLAALENKWRLATLLVFFGLGGNLAGVFAFAPSYVTAAVAACGLVLLAYAFFVGLHTLPTSGALKMLVIAGVSFTLGGLLVMTALPPDLVSARLAPFLSGAFFTERYWKIRSALSVVSLKTWISHLWIGTGLGSFALDFRFGASAENWLLLPRGAAAEPFGWWQALAERGVVGLVLFALPFGFLAFSYVRRAWLSFAGALAWPPPACLLGPLALALAIASGFFDCSPLMTPAVLAVCAFGAVAAASFSRPRKEDHV